MIFQVMNYVYKRLKFMNNRYVSQLSALVFLAVWHGWHSGYYLTFFNEFIVINFEKDFSAIWAKSSKFVVLKMMDVNIVWTLQTKY